MLNVLKPRPKAKNIILSEVVERESAHIINLIGYIILGLALLDYAVILIPPQLFNPIWEFQTIGQLVEHSWSILLGLILVFYRRSDDQIKLGELRLLAIISQLTLVLGIAYFLAAPLLISNSLRINQQNSSTINQQILLQSEQVENFETRLNQQTETQLEALIAKLPQQQENAKITSPEDFKVKVLENIKAKEESSKQQIQQNFKAKQKQLSKNTFKWLLGAILTGFSLIYIWKSTQWTRVLQREHKVQNMNSKYQ